MRRRHAHRRNRLLHALGNLARRFQLGARQYDEELLAGVSTDEIGVADTAL